MFLIKEKPVFFVIYPDVLMCIRRYLDYSCRSLLCHVVDGVLVSQPIRPLHCVIEMPSPVIILHVPQSCIDPAL